jgi:phage tail sheath protein FI
MPEYLAPGVFVEEVSFRHKSIEGVGTSVAGLVGPTRFGPVRGKPLLCTSFLDFQRYFGDARNLMLGTAGAEVATVNHTAYAARAFFDNGGKQLFVTRVIEGGGGAATYEALGSAKFAAKTVDLGGGTRLTMRARFPGAAGNMDLVFTPRATGNLVSAETVAFAALKNNDTVLVGATNVAVARLIQPPGQATPAGIGMPIATISGVARYKASDKTLTFVAGTRIVVVDKDAKTHHGTPAALCILGLNAPDNDSFATARFRSPAAAVDGAVYTLAMDQRVVAMAANGPAGAEVIATASFDKTAGTFKLLKAPDSADPDVVLPLAALARAESREPARVLRRVYDVTAELDGEALYEFGTLSPAPADAAFFTRGMPVKPQKLADDISQPAAATLTGPAPTEAVLVATLEAAFEPGPLKPANPAVAPRRILRLAGGTDGKAPIAVDYKGDQDEQRGSTGFAALEDVDEISIVLAPAAAASSRATYRAIIAEMQAHLRRMRYRVGVIDSQRNMTIAEVRDFRADISDDRLALYYPWVRAAGLTPEWPEVQLPPSGYVAGLYAGTDVRRGVHKAPANEVVLGAIGLEANINQNQQELLNPLGINCLRFFPNRGYRVWGGRTLADDPEWKYVNVRRYFLFLEKSIERATGWAVFEPNGEDLWANIRATVDDFLYNEWFNRHLLGATPEQAYFVRCDRSTMTQNDLDNGRLVCLIGVAPLRPAEFVIFRIGQKTADAR